MSDTTPPPPGQDPGPTPPSQSGSQPSGQGSYQPGATPPPFPSEPAPTQPPPGVGRPAELLPRFLARLIDYVLLGVVNGFVVGFVVITLILGFDAQAGWGIGARSYAAEAVRALLGAALFLGYFTLMESSQGQTIGKMLLKLETQGPGGGRPTLQQALKRNAFTALGVLGIIPGLGGVLAGLLSLVALITIAVTISNNTATRQGWHDEFAGGTRVVKVG